MANYALVYLVKSFFGSIWEFISHWYLNGFYIWRSYTLIFLRSLEGIFAFRINLRHFFEPLYQDRTVIGYILGFVFRSMRLLVGGVVYVLIIPATIAVYIFWAIVPIYIIYKLILNY